MSQILRSHSQVSLKTTTKKEPLDVQIRPARLDDVKKIAQVHIRSFPSFFLTNLGLLFLRTYYSFVLHYKEHIFFIVEYKGEPVGFAAGYEDPARFYRSMALKAWRFLIPLFLSIIKHPILLPRLWRNIHKVLFLKQHPDYDSKCACEIASLAVDPRYAGQGFGKIVVENFIAAAKSRNISQVRLTTDTMDNDQINAFYQKFGFKLYRTFLAFDTRLMNEYVFSIVKNSTADSFASK
jgi:ribosomal protein S18 acetylase RimI-like enzyme